jgi:glutamate mutase epsilon subunit
VIKTRKICTISDFRKDNKKAISKVFKEFNKFCMGLKLFSKSYISIDGSKFKVVNAKDNNLTLSKLDDRIKRLDEHISVYMEELEAYDHEEGVDVLESTVDKGYERPEDHADALANGIVPNVIQRDGNCTEQVQFDYNEISSINAANPDLLWIGMTAPKQEKWTYSHW